MFEKYDEQDGTSNQQYESPDNKPIEPEKRKITTQLLLKWLFFLFFASYILLSYYYAPILTRLGRYLILEHPPRRSDLIVCLAGGNIERGLSTADAFKQGLAPRILITREELPDGYELAKERGIDYPKNVDLLVMLLRELEVPESAIIIGESTVRSTIDEAKLVRAVVKKKGYRSLIILTSPTHTRRAWLTFRKIFKDSDVRILVISSKYSKFRPEDWWKKRRYVRAVIIEYQKLLFYALKYFM